MKAKRIITIIFTLILALLLISCGAGSNSPGGGNTLSGGDTPTGGDSNKHGGDEDPQNENNDPCPCCPDCIQEECECDKCAKSNKCKCTPGGGDDFPPLTFNIEIVVDLTDPDCNFDGCGMSTSGSAVVTMNFVDRVTGYFGTSADGVGVTTRNGSHETAVRNAVIPGDLRNYEFTAQLSVPADYKKYTGADGDYITILVGVDRLGPDEITYNLADWGGGLENMPGLLLGTFDYLMQHPLPSDVGTAYADPDMGLLIFEMPLMDTPITVIFTWGEDLYIYITLSPVG